MNAEKETDGSTPLHAGKFNQMSFNVDFKKRRRRGGEGGGVSIIFTRVLWLKEEGIMCKTILVMYHFYSSTARTLTWVGVVRT